MGEKPKLITRRNVLQGTAAVLIAESFRSLYNSLYDTWDDIIKGVRRVTGPEFDNFSKLEQSARTGRAWIIVHKNFFGDKPDFENFYNHYLWGSYDRTEYQEYLAHINGLMKQLRNSNEPIVILMPNWKYQHGDFRDVPSRAAIVVTIDADNTPKRYIYTPRGTQIQNTTHLKQVLKNMGVHTLNFAGEIGVHRYMGGDGCVAAAARDFAKDFNVKGVTGCIYPLTKPSHSDQLQHKLYYDTVPIPIR